VAEILSPAQPLGLRLCGKLLLGVVRVWQWKMNYLWDDCHKTFQNIKESIAENKPHNVSKEQHSKIIINWGISPIKSCARNLFPDIKTTFSENMHNILTDNESSDTKFDHNQASLEEIQLKEDPSVSVDLSSRLVDEPSSFLDGDDSLNLDRASPQTGSILMDALDLDSSFNKSVEKGRAKRDRPSDQDINHTPVKIPRLSEIKIPEIEMKSPILGEVISASELSLTDRSRTDESCSHQTTTEFSGVHNSSNAGAGVSVEQLLQKEGSQEQKLPRTESIQPSENTSDPIAMKSSSTSIEIPLPAQNLEDNLTTKVTLPIVEDEKICKIGSSWVKNHVEVGLPQLRKLDKSNVKARLHVKSRAPWRLSKNRRKVPKDQIKVLCKEIIAVQMIDTRDIIWDNPPCVNLSTKAIDLFPDLRSSKTLDDFKSLLFKPLLPDWAPELLSCYENLWNMRKRPKGDWRSERKCTLFAKNPTATRNPAEQSFSASWTTGSSKTSILSGVRGALRAAPVPLGSEDSSSLSSEGEESTMKFWNRKAPAPLPELNSSPSPKEAFTVNNNLEKAQNKSESPSTLACSVSNEESRSISSLSPLGSLDKEPSCEPDAHVDISGILGMEMPDESPQSPVSTRTEHFLSDVVYSDHDTDRPAGWTIRTEKTLKYLNSKHQKSFVYEDLVKGKNRRTALGFFYELLVLKTHDMIDLNQEAAFRKVRFSKTEKLLNRVCDHQ